MLDINDDTVSYRYVIDTFLINLDINKTNYQHECFHKDGIKYNRLITSPSTGFIWIILAKFIESFVNCHLVNIRWPTDLDTKEWGSKGDKELFANTSELLSYKELYETQSSEWNSTTTYANYNILILLKWGSEFIRKGRVVKIMKR